MGSCLSTDTSASTPTHHNTDNQPKTAPPPQDQNANKENKPQAKAVEKAVLTEDSFRMMAPENVILELTAGKPLDATDVKDFDYAKSEIKFLRQFAKQFLEGGVTKADEVCEGGVGISEQVDKDRGALYDKQDFSSFQKVSYDKPEDTRTLIHDAIRTNVLFENESQEEIVELIDAFKPLRFKAGERVITQGDTGDEFFVVESGTLTVHVLVGEKGRRNEVKVGDYKSGSAFGELALIFGSPRAATILATEDVKLWCLDRETYRSMISQLRYEEHQQKREFLQSCEVSGQHFIHVFEAWQIEDLTIAMKSDSFKRGKIILREGEIGDTMYVLKSGTVQTSLKGEDKKVIDQKKVFGTTSLMKGTAAPYTYTASSDEVTVYYLTKEDFTMIIGFLPEDNTTSPTPQRTRTTIRSQKILSSSLSTRQQVEIELDQLEFHNMLGKGAFGHVTLVQAKGKFFALKALPKDLIVEKRQQEHVLNEYRIMKLMSEIDDPNIIGVHCALQDKKYLYFLVDLLPGGELMTHLRRERQFTEDTTKFFAASVVLALEQMHPLLIAYRDLKPENIVLNKKGFGVLVDFGLAKEVEGGQTYTFCGTPDYLAPEIIRGTGHDWAVDYWCLGILLFELANGTAPFYAQNQTRRTRRILKGVNFLSMPSHFSNGLIDLITSLLNNDQTKRLGRTQNGVQAIVSHRWFAGVDWDGLRTHTIDAPFKPSIPTDLKTLGMKVPAPIQGKVADSDWWPDMKAVSDNVWD